MLRSVSIAALGLVCASSALAGEVAVDLQVRPRLENSLMGNFYNQPTQAARAAGSNTSNHMISQRSRATMHAGFENADFHLSIQDVRRWGTEGNTLGDFAGDAMDFHEAWGQFMLGGVQLRVGRQEFVVDEQRLIGAVNWTQQGRAFDGMRLRLAEKDLYEITAFAARLMDGGAHDMLVLNPVFFTSGIRASVPIIVQTNRGIASDDRGSTNEFDRVTAGAHIKQGGDLFWRVEGYVQAGTHPTAMYTPAAGGDPEAQKVMAYMAGLRAGYKVNDMLKPTLWVDFLSGDADGTDDTNNAFDTLFATNHAFYGFMDRFLAVPGATGQGGLIDVALKNAGKIGPGTLKTDFHYFMLAAENTMEQKGAIGAELDVVYIMKLVESVKLLVGASVYADLGDGAKLSDGSDKNKAVHDWMWVMLDFNTAS